jgi:hypothetical protein
LRKWEFGVDGKIVNGEFVWNTIVDKLMDKHFDVKRNVIDSGIDDKQ